MDSATHALGKKQNRAPRSQKFVASFLRGSLTVIAIAAQIALFIMLVTVGVRAVRWVAVLSVAASVVALIFILNSKMQLEYKLAWSIVILLLPFAGGVFYLLFGSRTGTRRQVAKYNEIQAAARQNQLSAPKAITDGKCHVEPRAEAQLTYLEKAGPFFAYSDTETTYYPLGDEAFPAMMEAIENAKNWIGLEYFIVAKGKMLTQLVQALKRKVDEGVKVYFLYDDLGSIFKVPFGFLADLREAGIQAQPVNRFGPGLTLRYNNRDHRKFLIVDGDIAFTGGINIGDEYINEIERFGHWRDTVIRLKGPGAWGAVTLFFTIWDLVTGQATDLATLRPDLEHESHPGIVLNFDDTPFDDVSIGWAAYRNVISKAERYVYITTPYLVPSAEQLDVLTSAALSGVRVCIMTPGIPDKRAVWEVTRSNYLRLLEAGVEIYEYSPGFLHAKQIVSDDRYAIIGTINFDFRSFYLHQENGVWMCDTPVVGEMVEDFENLLSKCHKIELAQVRNIHPLRRLLRVMLRTFSPML